MSRNGVTFEQVREVKMAITSRGERATQEKVRQELGGTGSYSTIAAHLRALAEEELQTTVRKIDIPNELKEDVSSLVQHVWERASNLANSDVELIRRTTSKNVEILSEQLKDAIETMDKLEEDLAKSKSRLAKYEADIVSLKESNAAYEGILTIRLNDEDKIAKSMKELIDQLTNLVCEQGRMLEGMKRADK